MAYQILTSCSRQAQDAGSDGNGAGGPPSGKEQPPSELRPEQYSGDAFLDAAVATGLAQGRHDAGVFERGEWDLTGHLGATGICAACSQRLAAAFSSCGELLSSCGTQASSRTTPGGGSFRRGQTTQNGTTTAGTSCRRRTIRRRCRASSCFWQRRLQQRWDEKT